MQQGVERYSKEYFLLDKRISTESWYHLLMEVGCIVTDEELLGVHAGRLRPGRSIRKIMAMFIELKGNKLSEDVLLAIDARITHPVFILLSCGDYLRACMACKLPRSRRCALPHELRYHYATRWLPQSELSLPIPTTDLDHLYFSLMQSVAGWKTAPANMQELEEQVRKNPPPERQYHLFRQTDERRSEEEFWRGWRKTLKERSIPGISDILKGAGH